MGGKRITGSPEELRRQAMKLVARAARTVNRALDLERKARVLEKKRDAHEKKMWPEEFCETCKKGKKKCFLHREEGTDLVYGPDERPSGNEPDLF